MARVAALLAVALVAGVASGANIVIAGDSWGTEGRRAFLDMLQRHGSNLTVENIAVSGATTDDWIESRKLRELEEAVAKPDVKTVWVTLMGNDAKNRLPACGLEGHSPSECTAKIVAHCQGNMEKVLAAIAKANPKARVVGFGYDILGLGKDNGICHLLPVALFPKCGENITCFNQQFLSLQGVWEGLAKSHSFVDVVNLLGSLEVASGDQKAKIGHPDLSEFSPASLMQKNCIHPNDKGFGYIFDNLWNLYLHKF